MATDLLNRRLRAAPPSARVRRLVLTDADYLIFEAINRHGPLSTQYLYAFTKHLRRDYTHLQNRLTEFYNGDRHGSYLVRPFQQFDCFGARYHHLVYDLAPRAKSALAERSAFVRLEERRSYPFVHQLMGACATASIELTAARSGLRYIPLNEILAHHPCEAADHSGNPMAIPIPGGGGQALVPDALFGLQYPGVGFRFFAVEIDRGTESIERSKVAQSAFGRKICRYCALLHHQAYRAWWGVPNLHILTITTGAVHARNLLIFIGKQVPPQFAGRFAVAVQSEFGAHWKVPREILAQLITEPWQTPIGSRKIGSA